MVWVPSEGGDTARWQGRGKEGGEKERVRWDVGLRNTLWLLKGKHVGRTTQAIEGAKYSLDPGGNGKARPR